MNVIKDLDLDLLCLIDFYTKYEWIITLKDKKGITITDTFQNNF